ncbi:hypothetical protein MYP_4232 [Sporocytophaga myxococcoides]|uniref:Uncharacterized protein n=1 Tax=Sporocytophaga myxococcoides TaxID=153721 RepID=A0A098LKV7_9BACT|nr:hypothetical protein MYP_4232 [Sporocytophaga myxococcoides]
MIFGFSIHSFLLSCNQKNDQRYIFWSEWAIESRLVLFSAKAFQKQKAKEWEKSKSFY